METVKAVLLIVGGLIIIGVLILIVLDQVYGVRFVRTAAKGVAAIIKIHAPLVGDVMDKLVDTIIWI